MAIGVFPTGTTVYEPDKCWNGYTLFPTAIRDVAKSDGTVLVDMNGNVINQWKKVDGFPSKMLPGGYLLGSTGRRNPQYGMQDMIDLIQVDWDGKEVWKFNRYELINDPGSPPTWMARQHHDYQREGNPVGYYVPGMDPLVEGGNTLMICHKNLKNPEISDKLLVDDSIIEITWDGKIIWEWNCNEHFNEMGFSDDARRAIAGISDEGSRAIDWMHINSVSFVGPNQWYDQGDKRFNPDNIIWSGRETNIFAIVERKSGRIVWRAGPDYAETPEWKKLGWIIGQHHAHIIPRGLPGEGNILVFDNGGSAGYGYPNPGAPDGVRSVLRDHSRVVEFNPVSLEVIWQYPEGPLKLESYLQLYSSFISSAQRLPNGNTLITEGVDGHLIEVTRDNEIVWDYVSPYYDKERHMNGIYRAYRVPYSWVPQADIPKEKAVPRVVNSEFRVTVP
jgi:hypothetical protein